MKTALKICGALALACSLAVAQPKPKSQSEVEALQAIMQATDPKAKILAVETLLTKFADTEFKTWALLNAADAAQRSGDSDTMIIYAERALESDPKSYDAMLMIAGALSQRTREHDLDREEKLNKAEKMAKDAAEAVKTAAKPNPQITDEQWEGMKKETQASAHETLGIIAMVRKKPDVAITHFNQGLTLLPQPNPSLIVRLAGAYNQAGKPDEAIAALDKLSGATNLHPAVKQLSDRERQNAMKLKGGTPAAAKPAATPAPAAASAPTATPSAAPAVPPAK